MGVAPIILTWTHQDPIVIDYARPFFQSLIWSILPLNILIVMQQFLIGINKTKIVVFTSVLAAPVDIFFYYSFLFGKFGLPKLGLAGIGYGLVISYSLTTLFLYFYFSNYLKAFQLFNNWWIVNKKFLLELIRIGSPLGFMFCIEDALFTAVAIMMGILGTTVLAAYQIAYQYLMLAYYFRFNPNSDCKSRE
jgi:MATE family multidrug resistance protein